MVNQINKRINVGYILSIGKINLKSGHSKWFNVYETWGEDTTYEIYLIGEGNYRIVATSGKRPLYKIGDIVSMVSSQPSRRELFTGKLVGWSVGSDLKNRVEEFGQYILGFTYK